MSYAPLEFEALRNADNRTFKETCHTLLTVKDFRKERKRQHSYVREGFLHFLEGTQNACICQVAA